MRLDIEGRGEPTVHTTAKYRLSPATLKIDKPAVPLLPVAAFPEYPGEIRMVLRAKPRPMLVLGFSETEVNADYTKRHGSWQTNPTMIVAPYYGAQKNKRLGWDPRFVERIRRCGYPQYMWDILPGERGEESILRLDHLQAIPIHPERFRLLGFRLADEALGLVREWLHWLLHNQVPQGGVLEVVRDGLYVEEG